MSSVVPLSIEVGALVGLSQERTGDVMCLAKWRLRKEESLFFTLKVSVSVQLPCSRHGDPSDGLPIVESWGWGRGRVKLALD